MNKIYRIGVDLGGTNIKVGVVNEANEIVGKASSPTGAQRPWQDIVADIAKTIDKALAAAGIGAQDCASLGVGCPGTIDSASGNIIYANNLAWDNVPLGKALGEIYPLPVRVANDANCATLGEVVAGAAKEYQSAVMLTLGTGVGGGVVIRGKLMEGGPGDTELGHTTLILGGEPCTCGRAGCLEAYASASAIVREGKRRAEEDPKSIMNEMMRKNGGKMNGRIPFDAARAGDAAGQKVVDDYIYWLAAGIANMVNIFRPEVVLLSGGVCNEGEYLTKPLQKLVAKFAYAGERMYIPPVLRAQLGNDAGIIGAANL